MSPEMGDKVLKSFQVFELEILKIILIFYRKYKKLNGLYNENDNGTNLVNQGLQELKIAKRLIKERFSPKNNFGKTTTKVCTKGPKLSKQFKLL